MGRGVRFMPVCDHKPRVGQEVDAAQLIRLCLDTCSPDTCSIFSLTERKPDERGDHPSRLGSVRRRLGYHNKGVKPLYQHRPQHPYQYRGLNEFLLIHGDQGSITEHRLCCLDQCCLDPYCLGLGLGRDQDQRAGYSHSRGCDI